MARIRKQNGDPLSLPEAHVSTAPLVPAIKPVGRISSAL
jgi:hypothetical protein